MTTEEKIKVMQAFVDGKQIQCKWKSCGDWHNVVVPDPTWDWERWDYRVKPEVDWSKIKVNTRILVSDDGVLWIKRYFAKYEDGKVFYFYGGVTSWSNNGFMLCSCPYAKLAEEDEK